MTSRNGPSPSALRGTARLLHDAVAGTADVVERMHGTIQSGPFSFGGRSTETTRGVTGLVYRAVHGTIGLVGHTADATLALLGEAPPPAPSPAMHTYRAIVNGVFGDHLARTGNPLAVPMGLHGADGEVNPRNPRPAGAGREAGRRLLLLVHGLCMSDQGWHRQGHDHGSALARDLAWQPLYLRYNSGLAITENGRRLARLLETLIGQWPVPLEEFAILGHSMGGLVARSAVHEARSAGLGWPDRLRKLVFLGTPHHGTLLERGGSYLDSAVSVSAYSRPLARLTTARSAGITDLRHGVICRAGGHVALPAGVDCHAVAAVLGTKGISSWERMVGDGLVPVDSALGCHRDPARDLGLPADRQWVGRRMDHHDLLSHPNVYARLREWLA